MNQEQTPHDNDLIVPLAGLPAAPHAGDEKFDTLIKATQFLPRIQLFGGNSAMVQEGKIAIAHFGLVRSSDSVEDLGDEVDQAPIRYRYKAMEIADGEVNTYHDPEHAEFKRIHADSEKQDSGCMYGVEFLLWLAEKQEFVSYFMNSKSARREAPTLRGLIGQLATLKVKLVKTKKYKWHAPVVTVCSTPFDLPDEAKMIKEVEKFDHPPDNTDEVADKDEQKQSERAR
jgi:hypothetical protein